MLSLYRIRELVKSHPSFFEKKFTAGTRNLSLFSYHYAHTDNYRDKSEDLLQLRGITYDRDTGELAALPYHKFFNFGEMVTQFDVTEYVIFEKLDGSMVFPIPHDDTFSFATGKGLTEVAKVAQDFISDKPAYSQFINKCLDKEWTPIFEWCSAKMRVVLTYPEDRLVLTGIRKHKDGSYLTHSEMLEEAVGIDVVNILPVPEASTTDWVSSVREIPNAEGFVCRKGNHFLKIKCDDYMKAHHSIDLLKSKNQILDLVLDGKVDDLKARMVTSTNSCLFRPGDKEALEEFETKVWDHIKICSEKFLDEIHLEMSDKEFATGFAKDHPHKGLLMMIRRNPKDAYRIVHTYASKHRYVFFPHLDWDSRLRME